MNNFTWWHHRWDWLWQWLPSKYMYGFIKRMHMFAVSIKGYRASMGIELNWIELNRGNIEVFSLSYYQKYEIESQMKYYYSSQFCSCLLYFFQLYRPRIVHCRHYRDWTVPYAFWGIFIRDTAYFIYRLITAYLLLRVNLDKIMHAGWDFDASSARNRRVSALDKHQNWSASALFCLNSWAQSKYAVVNLIHTRRIQTFLSFIMW